jgi:hypothetical protein
MIIPRDHRQSMLHGNGGNPNIVLWDWSTPDPQVVLNSPVLPSCRSVTGKDNRIACEFFDPGDVRIDLARLASPIKEFTQDNRGHEHLGSLSQVIHHTRVPGENRDDDIRIEQESTTHLD